MGWSRHFGYSLAKLITLGPVTVSEAGDGGGGGPRAQVRHRVFRNTLVTGANAPHVCGKS